MNFIKKILEQCLIVAFLTVVMVVGGILIGLPMLSVMYHVDLTPFRKEFVFLLLGGGFYAMAYN